MKDFTNLESLHKHLEYKALDYKYPHQISSLFQKVRDLKTKENKPVEAEKAQWEIDFFNFGLENDQIEPKFIKTSDKGEIVKYPSLDRSDDRTYEYLIERLNKTSNPLLKARYSHILWCSPRKHVQYAKLAVDSYLKLIKIYEEKDREAPQEHFGLDVIQAVRNAYSIGYQVKYKVEKVKSEVKRLITEFNFKSSSSFALRSDLIELMLRGKRKFSKKDFNKLENFCWQMSESLIDAENIHAAIRMLELGERIDQKLGKRTHDWRGKMAESYENLMNQAEKNNDPVSADLCQLALKNYKIIKDEEKIKELEEKYIKLKNLIKLKEIKVDIDLEEKIKIFRGIAEEIVQNPSEEIISLLMHDKNLLPTYKGMEKAAEEYSTKSLSSLFPKKMIDLSGNPAQHFSDEAEKKYFDILRMYQWELEVNKIYLINEIFLAAIRANKLSADTILKYLSRHSWFGKTISKKLPSDQTIEYNWLNLIAPALYEYFRQMHYFLLNPTNYPNLVLSIDSLTLKIEGLVRDIYQFSGGITSYMTQDSKGRDIRREKDIHALLYEEPIKKLFDEDDLLFLKFLLVEKAGYNLRHKIAHSLMLFQEYSVQYMYLLILAVLRLGKYDFVKDTISHNSE